jgi:hypothetical protein
MMRKSDLLTKLLACIGTVLVWLPILSPALLSAIRFIAGRTLHFDYLMPAELFPVALVGGGLLLWAALRAHLRWGMIGGGLGTAAVFLIGGQALAVATGLASGETEPIGWPWAFVLASIGIYSLALVVIGVGGVLLLRDLFKSSGSLTESG